MQRIATPEVVKLTPHMAEKLLTKHANYEGQRNFRTRMVNHYANEIRHDEFHTPVIMLAQQKYNGGEEVMLNGHHTCQSVIQANKPVFACIERWAVETDIEEAELYGKFDGVGGRTQSDYVKALATSMKLDWPLFVCNAIVSAAAMKENKESSLYAADKAKLLKIYTDAGKFFNFIFNTGLPDGVPMSAAKHMRRKAVYYPMLMTWEKCHRDAELFWTDVRDGEGLKRSMPQHLLREFLLTHGSNIGRGVNVGMSSVTQHEMISRCITAWNAFRKNRKVKLLKYYPARALPKAV